MNENVVNFFDHLLEPSLQFLSTSAVENSKGNPFSRGVKLHGVGKNAIFDRQFWRNSVHTLVAFDLE